MIKTKNIALSPREVDSEWAFRMLLGLPPITGGQAVIRSPFSVDHTPSFRVFKKDDMDQYMFKCFSSGKGGDMFTLKVELDAIKGIYTSRTEARKYLKDRFNNILNEGNYQPIVDVKVNTRGKVADYTLTPWTKLYLDFWAQFEISLPTLEFYYTIPIKSFKMEKVVDDIHKSYVFNDGMFFGYFRKTGELHKIYCPGRKPKAIKVGPSYMEGSDQIFAPRTNLLINSSNKDNMGWRELGFDDWDTISSDAGENTLIPERIMKEYLETYQGRIKSLFNNDAAGRKATAAYKTKYGIEPIQFEWGEKDLTDTMKKYGIAWTRKNFLPYL